MLRSQFRSDSTTSIAPRQHLAGVFCFRKSTNTPEIALGTHAKHTAECHPSYLESTLAKVCENKGL
jgi:hypothetical protein